MADTTPTVTIYVRHSKGCKYSDDQFSKRCNCRKSLDYSKDGVRVRRSAKTRSWAEAEKVKREVEDELSGKTVAPAPTGTRTIRAAADAFTAEKQLEGLSSDLIQKYKLWLGRYASYMEAQGVYTLGGITRELLTGFCSGWETQYPSALTRQKLRERYKSFMRFCVASDWLGKAPEWPKIKGGDKAPTLPLTDEEYERLLAAVDMVVRAPENPKVENQTYEYWKKRVRGLFLLMRWSGLSIMDALTLPRARMTHQNGKHRIVTARTKTGTDVSVPLPPAIAEELLAIPNENPLYFFWSGKGEKKSICGNWGKRFIVPCFEEAEIESDGYMRAHRLRDTFACDLLTKGLPIEDVARLLGHRSVRTTEKHYSAWVRSRQDSLDAKVESTW